MRYLTLALLTCFFLSACSTYQYMTLSSPQMKKNDKQQLVFENDTLSLTYDFNGKDGPVSIYIHNKTNDPLYVNWKKSALIRDEHSFSYYDRRIPFSGDGIAYGSRYVSVSNFNGSLTLPEGIAFIPPGASISKPLVFLSQSGPTALAIPDSVQQQKIPPSSTTIGIKYRQISYDETQSPLKFKSYLVFTLGLNNTKEFAQNSSFYVSDAIETSTAPEEFSLYQQQGDKFFFTYKRSQ